MPRVPTPALAIPLAMLLGPPLAAAGCADADDAPAALDPVEGHWSLEVTATTEDTCGIADALPPATGWTLAWDAGSPDTAGDTGAAGRAFTLVPDDADDTWACTFQDPDFSCALTRTESGSAGGDGYTLTYAWALEGSFSSDTEAAGTHALTLRCTDSNDAFCDDIAARQDITFPCALGFAVALTADAAR